MPGRVQHYQFLDECVPNHSLEELQFRVLWVRYV